MIIEVATGTIEEDLLSQNFKLDFHGMKFVLLGLGVVVGVDTEQSLGLKLKNKLIDPLLLLGSLSPELLKLLLAVAGGVEVVKLDRNFTSPAAARVALDALVQCFAKGHETVLLHDVDWLLVLLGKGGREGSTVGNSAVAFGTSAGAIGR